ncbi:MAG: ABC transporter substrate-binding protein [Planctomycetaceae bacterium]|nr:ABC transporter substrate-binding protein [Planctomycetaceae bacterium]
MSGLLVRRIRRDVLASLVATMSIAMGACAVAGCAPKAGSAGGGADGSAAPRAPRIACVFEPTGAVSELDRAALKGAMLAREELGGTWWGIDIVSVASAASSAEGAIAAFGCSDSDELRAAFAPFAAKGAPFLAVGATDPCLARLPGGERLSFACYSDPAQGAAMAEFAHGELGARRVTVLFEAPGDFPIAVSQAFVAAARALDGMTTTSVAFTDARNPSVDEALRVRPDAVYLACLPSSVVPAIGALREAGFDGAILGPDSFDVPDVAQASLGAPRYFSTHAWFGKGAGSAQTLFASLYRAKFGEEPSAFSALGYDAMQAMARALEALPRERRTRDGVADALRALAPHDGVSGEIVFPKAGHFASKPVFIVKAANDGRSLARRLSPARVPEPNCAR